MERVLVASGVVKQVGRERAAGRVLDGVDVSVQAGEMLAVLGRSGSGKSTLLHLLGGLDRPDAGSLRVLGDELVGASDRVLTRLRLRRIGSSSRSPSARSSRARRTCSCRRWSRRP